jgi:hypothetical protein
VAWSYQSSRFVERWRSRLDGRPAVVRPRAEVVTVHVEGGAAVVRSSALAEGVRRAGVAPSAVLQPVRGFWLPGLGAACELEPGVDWFVSCGAPGELPERFWTAAGRGRARAAIVPPASPGGAPTLWLRLGDSAPELVAGVGAQLALAASERGELVATSDPSQPGEPDALTVRALAPGAPLVHRLDHLPGAVRALGAGDLDGDGRAEFVAAVRDAEARRTELWILR